MFKAMYRLYLKSKAERGSPATPTSSILRSVDGRATYRIWSDGSYRKIVLGKRRVVAT